MYFVKQLKSKIKVVLVPKKDTEIITIACGFKVGSRYENMNQSGISHFLEHMIYKGARRRKTPLEVAKYIDSLGGDHNAFTSKECTSFYVTLSSRHYLKALDFLSDNIVYASIPIKELEREKGVLLEEINMYEDLPSEKASILFEKSIFSDTPIAKSLSGKKEVILEANQEFIQKYKNCYYTKDNMAVVITGKLPNISNQKICDLIEEYFKDLPSRADKARGAVDRENRLVATDKKIKQANFVVGYGASSLKSDDRYATDLLAKILGGSMSSRLFTKVREKLGLVYRIHTSTTQYLDVGSIETSTSLKPENVDKALKEIVREYKKIADDGVGSDELKIAKEVTCGSIILDNEDASDLAIEYLVSLLVEGEIHRKEKEIKKYKDVGVEDVNKVAKKYLSTTPHLSIVGPKNDLSKLKRILK